jgi:hypothetical protein
MKMEIKLPTTMAEIPLRSYQQYLQVVRESNDEEFIAHKFVHIFLGLKLNEALKISAKDMKRLIAKLKSVLTEKPEFVNRFKIQDVEFGFIPDIENMSWGEYIDIEDNLQSWDSYHKAMAVMYRPITKTLKDTYEIQPYDAKEEYVELMKLAPLNIVLASSVFFWSLEIDLLNHTLDCLANEKKMPITTSSQLNDNLKKVGGGITAYIDWLKVTLDDLMKSPLCLSIEHLPSSYTKHKKTRSKQNVRNEH